MWWLKARRAHTVLPLALAAFLVLTVVVQDGSAVLPSFTNGLDPVPLMLFVPMPLVVGLMLCLESRLDAAEVSGTRPVPFLDTALSLAVVVAAALAGRAAEALLDSAQAAATGRNTAFLAGLMLLVRSFAGQPAIMAPVAWLVAVLLFGFSAGNDPQPWTILPEPPSAGHAVIAATLTLTAGLAAQLLTPRNPS